MAGRFFVWLLLLLLLAGQALESRVSAETVRVVTRGPVSVVSTGGSTESSAKGVDTTLGGALRSLASRASVVFVGQVASIAPKGGVVEIHLLVQQAVMGKVGGTYTLREWGGLWAGGQQRYRVGERAMFFLHRPAGGSGLSSPVDGAEGVVPVVPTGADVAPLLDVRRLATRVLRGQGQPMAGEAIALPEAVGVVAAWQSSEREPVQVRLPRGVRPVAVVSGVQSGADDANR